MQPLIYMFVRPNHIPDDHYRYHRCIECIDDDGGSRRGALCVRIQIYDGSLCILEICNVDDEMD